MDSQLGDEIRYKMTMKKQKPNYAAAAIAVVLTAVIMYKCTGIGDSEQAPPRPKVRTVKSTTAIDEIKNDMRKNEAKFNNRVAMIKAKTKTISFSGGQNYTLENETIIYISSKGYIIDWANGTVPAVGDWIGGLSFSFEGETLSSATGAGKRNMTDSPISNGLLRYNAKKRTLTITETNLSGGQKITKYNDCKIKFNK